jgi:hypothetical protein
MLIPFDFILVHLDESVLNWYVQVAEWIFHEIISSNELPNITKEQYSRYNESDDSFKPLFCFHIQTGLSGIAGSCSIPSLVPLGSIPYH